MFSASTSLLSLETSSTAPPPLRRIDSWRPATACLSLDGVIGELGWVVVAHVCGVVAQTLTARPLVSDPIVAGMTKFAGTAGMDVLDQMLTATIPRHASHLGSGRVSMHLTRVNSVARVEIAIRPRQRRVPHVGTKKGSGVKQMCGAGGLCTHGVNTTSAVING